MDNGRIETFYPEKSVTKRKSRKNLTLDWLASHELIFFVKDLEAHVWHVWWGHLKLFWPIFVVNLWSDRHFLNLWFKTFFQFFGKNFGSIWTNPVIVTATIIEIAFYDFSIGLGWICNTIVTNKTTPTRGATCIADKWWRVAEKDCVMTVRNEWLRNNCWFHLRDGNIGALFVKIKFACACTLH